MINFNEKTHYKVKSGDTASSIAQTHNLTLDELKALNPDTDLGALIVSFNCFYNKYCFKFNSFIGRSNSSHCKINPPGKI